MLHELFEFGERVTNAYDNFAFNRGNIWFFFFFWDLFNGKPGPDGYEQF